MSHQNLNPVGEPSVWLQLEVYTTGETASDDALSALRDVHDRLKAGEMLGAIKGSTGEEIGWFDARPDNDARG